jgi:hypothetical protein
MVFALGNSGNSGTDRNSGTFSSFPSVKHEYQFGATFPTRMQSLEAEITIATCWAGVRMVPGARIELATPAFSGRRSTTELPRH